jgi:hypothetical protein
MPKFTYNNQIKPRKALVMVISLPFKVPNPDLPKMPEKIYPFP